MAPTATGVPRRCADTLEAEAADGVLFCTALRVAVEGKGPEGALSLACKEGADAEGRVAMGGCRDGGGGTGVAAPDRVPRPEPVGQAFDHIPAAGPGGGPEDVAGISGGDGDP